MSSIGPGVWAPTAVDADRLAQGSAQQDEIVRSELRILPAVLGSPLVSHWINLEELEKGRRPTLRLLSTPRDHRHHRWRGRYPCPRAPSTSNRWAGQHLGFSSGAPPPECRESSQTAELRRCCFLQVPSETV